MCFGRALRGYELTLRSLEGVLLSLTKTLRTFEGALLSLTKTLRSFG